MLYLPQLAANLPVDPKEKAWQKKVSFVSDQAYAAERALKYTRHMLKQSQYLEEWKKAAFDAEDKVWKYIMGFRKTKAFKETKPSHVCLCNKEHLVTGKLNYYSTPLMGMPTN